MKPHASADSPTGTSPRRALLRHRDPRRAGQVLLRLAGCPDRDTSPRCRTTSIARRARKTRARTAASTSTWPTPQSQQIHFIGQGTPYFHTLFWPAMLYFSGRKTPDRIYVHGFIQLSGGEDEQEPRHRPVAAALSRARHERRMAALLHRRQAQLARRGLRLQPGRLRRPHQQRPRRQVREHREPRVGFHRQALRRPAVCGRRRGARRLRERVARRVAPRSPTRSSRASTERRSGS